MSYFISHWRGKLPLKLSLWVNMIGLLLVISIVEIFMLARLSSAPTQMLSNTLISLFITRLIIFPWQLIGLFRAIEVDFIKHGNTLKTRALQGLALLTLVFTFVYSLGVIQSAVFYTRQLEFYAQPNAKVSYQLKVSEDQQRLEISGGLDIGITNAVRASLVAHPDIKSVSLQSGGGHIYEGRGLAKLFTEQALDTYVFAECSSACATAFIGGKQRYLGATGKLGFHQYKLDISQHRKMVPFYDTPAEQQRDLELFKTRGIKPAFLNKMFDQPASKIWFPDHQELLDANIVNKLISE